MKAQWKSRGLSLPLDDIFLYQLNVYFYYPANITYITVSCCLLIRFRNYNNYFIATVYVLVVK